MALETSAMAGVKKKKKEGGGDLEILGKVSWLSSLSIGRNLVSVMEYKENPSNQESC